MRIHRYETTIRIWLSANDTYNWAHRPGANWPCSQLSGHRVFAEYEYGDLVDISIDGISIDVKSKNVDANELNACIGDHMPTGPIHL